MLERLKNPFNSFSVASGLLACLAPFEEEAFNSFSVASGLWSSRVIHAWT